MSGRNNFTPAQRDSAFFCNADYLRNHSVDGIYIALAYENLHRGGFIYYCENCLFCHNDRSYFDVDHLVPDSLMKHWGKPQQSAVAVNMMILCKSRQSGDLGCNQSKGSRLHVPSKRGLAYTMPALDMNCCPLKDRPFLWT